ncbi:DUF262 domain-containing protein [Enterococcus sp. AZ177]|uniref:DUF262 domain-containing protein n=1 Tax=unclassified Enterococcus TaxID=2608891 RepID=UPI003D2FCD40
MSEKEVFESKSIKSKQENTSINDFVKKIENGFKIQSDLNYDLSDEETLEYTGAVIIAPDYQREYRSTIKDESSLIESVLVGIPIPPIFMAATKVGNKDDLHVYNVVDGQHRLRAFYRFKNNKFKLKGLTLVPEYEGDDFESLPLDIKQSILNHSLSAIIFDGFPGVDFELEIFNRYNKGTKPLTPQEIRHAVYNSHINKYVNSFVKEMAIEDPSPNPLLSRAYNTTRDRYQKKKAQENIFVVLSILEDGIDEKYAKSIIYAEEYMKRKAEFEAENPEESDLDYNNSVELFEGFNGFVEKLGENIEYPFSKEIYGFSNRNYKFQISIAMILSGIYNKIISEFRINEEPLKNFNKRINIKMFMDILVVKLGSSFLEDPDYNASSTNSKKMKELVDTIDFSAAIE